MNETLHGTSRTYAWSYDPLYRMTNENIGAINLGYAYDPVGNRTSRNATNVSQLQTASYSYNTNDWLTTDKYDSNGSTTNSGVNSYQYDVMNHVTNANSGAIVMTYDGDGSRVSKKVSGTTTYYLLDDRNPSGYAQVLEEYQGSTLSKVYNYGLSLISQRTTTGTLSTNYFICDGHGSTRLLTDIGGGIANAFAFDAYGTLIASNVSPQTAYLYCGQQLDSDLGFYLNRARYLKTDTGRFWTKDNVDGDNEDPLSLHKYLYGADNPVNMDDPLSIAASSTSGNNPAAILGNAVEENIMQDFQDKFGRYAVTDKSILNSLGLLGKAQLLQQALPDLVQRGGQPCTTSRTRSSARSGRRH